MTEVLENRLDALLKKSQDNSWNTSFLEDDLSTLLNAFLPSQPVAPRSKAYVVLSAICQRIRDKSPVGKAQADAGTDSLRKIFKPVLSTKLGETVETEALKAISFLSALFEVDWQSASALTQEDGFVDSVTDTIDLFPDSSDIARAVAQLLAHASGHKACRALITSQHRQWLESCSRETRDETLRATAVVALIKISRGTRADASEIAGTSSKESAFRDEEYVKLMMNLVNVSNDSSALRDAVEGLAYLSTDPKVKEMLVNDENFLKRLFATIPHHRKRYTDEQHDESLMSPLYGVTVTVCNLCTYPPRLSEEESQLAKLRQMAKGPDGKLQEARNHNVLDDNDHVKARGRRLINCGVLDVLAAVTRSTDSHAVRLVIGKSYLNLIEDVDNRGKILQAGGARMLILIIQGLLSSSSSSSRPTNLSASDIEPIQALAKLAITSSPVQVFGPNQGALYDAVRPFSIMLTNSSSNLLQRFEAIMALTNLASHSQEVATRIARADGLLNQVELLMLEDHVLVRRAATELICNLVCGCEEVFNKYGGVHSSASNSKLQILVALCDVDDLATRLAASGALATLTSSPDACQSMIELQGERQRVLPILGHLIDPSVVLVPSEESGIDDDIAEIAPHPGLTHRGVVCIRNLFGNIEEPSKQKEIAADAHRIGITHALLNTLKACGGNSNAPIFVPTSEALLWLAQHGVKP